MKKVFGDYYLGLDIGTDSVGWAVTDVNYNIEKFNKKSMWGVELFDGGNTAEERRIFRGNSRRNNRKKTRIKFLQELFAKEIAKVDENFYLRLKESKYYPEDRFDGAKYALFNNENFTDKDYNKKYPTIFHLRADMMKTKVKPDIRLVYLAIHNIIKNRGNFLFENQDLVSINNFENLFKNLSEYVNNNFETINLVCNDLDAFQNIIKSDKTITDKTKELKKIIEPSDQKINQMISLISGGTAKLSDLFDDDSYKDFEKNSFNFKDDFENVRLTIENQIQEKMEFINCLKSIYDWGILQNILKGNNSISAAKIMEFEKHKKDLKILKNYVKQHCPETYKEIFKEYKTIYDNYSSYIGMAKNSSGKKKLVPFDKNGDKASSFKKCSQEDFCGYISKTLGTIVEDDKGKYLKEELDKKTLMPKLTVKDNGTIPYQVHLYELQKIIENVSEFYPFLNEKDEYGTIADKIISIFKFRIPYFVGPLNDAHKNSANGHAWIIKKSQQPIRPWNFEEVVDTQASAEEFIRRMTNSCTYLIGEDVIPKNSLVYSRFSVLNELNNLKINDERISSVDLKQRIYNEVFKQKKKVTQKGLLKWLTEEGIITKGDEISGFDIDFKSSLSSEIDFSKIGINISNEHNEIEEIIVRIVLLGDDKKMFKSWLKSSCSLKLNEQQIKEILKFKYSGWGRLSEKFLTEIPGISIGNNNEEGTGEVFNSILEAMWNTNCNLMELLSNKYTFIEEIKKLNDSQCDSVDIPIKEKVDNLYVSPKIKRPILQSLEITEEIIKIMGHNPKKIFIEMAKGPSEDQKGRKESRKANLLDLYNKCKEEEVDWISEINKKTDSDFRRDRLYLYYTQMGKCMYTGKPIDIDDLFNENIYDVDHIYPQSKIKDDSINNRVLVCKTVNAEKTDKYPIDASIRKNMADFWKMLYKKEFISKKKYERLIRGTDFNIEELQGFIERQLVETRQTTKAVSQLLEELYGDNSEIIYSKAGNVSDFRDKFKLLKCRDINDYHHADDAYLNIVVGNVYNTKFTKNPANFLKEKNATSYNMKYLFEYDVKRGNNTAWLSGDNGTIALVKNTLNRSDKQFTRYSYCEKGKVADLNILRKENGQMPIKSTNKDKDGKIISDIKKYGGYNNVKGSYFILVEYDEKNKRVRSIKPVFTHKRKEYEASEQGAIDYCINELGLSNPKILIKQIKINTLFVINGFPMHLSGRTENRLIFKGAVQLKLNKETESYIRMVSKYITRVKELKTKDYSKVPFTKHEIITKEENLKVYDELFNKLTNSIYNKTLSSQVKILEKGRDTFISLNVGEQCQIIINLLSLFKCNSVTADLLSIGGGKSAGIMLVNSNINTESQCLIIHQSRTGLFSKEMNLAEL